MPEYLSPGVYIEEISTGPRPIEGVSTSTAGFVGPAERGPEYPELITSWLAFQRWYGGYTDGYLPYAVQGFFDNGGKRCFVTRIVADDAVATNGAVGNLAFFAIGRGAWGNNLMIKVDPATKSAQPNAADWFRISILYYTDPPQPGQFVDPTSTAVADLTNPNRREPDVLEVYDNLTHRVGATNSLVPVINTASKLVRIGAWNGAPARLPDQAFQALGGNGANGAAPPILADFDGDLNPIGGLPGEPIGRGRGLSALAEVDDVSLVIVPDHVNLGQPMTDAIVNHCELLKDRFAVLSVDRGQNNVQALQPPRDSTYGAVYFPWIYVFDPRNNDRVLVPPSGHVAGIIARTDIERGVHKAPANEVVRDALDLEFPVPTGIQDLLNPRGVNCLRDFRSSGRGIRLWGARTMASDPEWRYINVRRLFLYVEESVEEATQWVVFEPNDEPLWARVRRSITNFLIRVWRDGALMGTTQDEAFFVRCDRTTMTQDDIDNGRMICLIGLAPVKPAEFVIFRFSQKTADAPA